MKDPAVLFYTSDFITGTLTMTDAQRGKYIILLCLQHQQGYLTEDDMLKVCKVYDEKIFSKFDKDQLGYYYNERMKIESEKRQKHIERQRGNANKRWSKNEYHGKAMEYATSMPLEDEDESIINYNGIVENFHLYCDRMSKVSKLSEQRKKHIAARFKEFDYNIIVDVLKQAGKSDFLSGKNDRAWKADIDWIFNPTNFIKIMEGKYDNKINNKQTESQYKQVHANDI